MCLGLQWPAEQADHLTLIHQFDIRGLLFATGSGHELGVKEPCQLFVYNSDSACEVEKATKFDESLKFSQVLLLVYVVSYHGNSSSTYFALSDNVYRYIWLVFSGLPCCVCLFACAPLVSSWSTGIVQSLIARTVDINSGFGEKRYVKSILTCERRIAHVLRHLGCTAFQA